MLAEQSVRQVRSLDGLWRERTGRVASCSHLRRQDPERRQSCRTACRTAYRVRSTPQCHDRPAAWAADTFNAGLAGDGAGAVNRQPLFRKYAAVFVILVTGALVACCI